MAIIDESVSAVQAQLTALQQKVDLLAVRVDILERSGSHFTVSTIVGIFGLLFLCYFLFQYLKYRTVKYEELGP
jgi:hypothetical protein